MDFQKANHLAIGLSTIVLGWTVVPAVLYVNATAMLVASGNAPAIGGQVTKLRYRESGENILLRTFLWDRLSSTPSSTCLHYNRSANLGFLTGFARISQQSAAHAIDRRVG